jgi:hypothetical protein
MGGSGWPGSGGDDLQVGPGAERKQSVMRAKINVLAARPGTDSEPAFQVGHRRS